MIHENSIRILFRMVFPFFLNDHFPSDYCFALRHGVTRWVVMGTAGLQGGEKSSYDGDSNDKYIDDEDYCQKKKEKKRYPSISSITGNNEVSPHSDVITLYNKEGSELDPNYKRQSF